jgi:TolB-like protein
MKQNKFLILFICLAIVVVCLEYGCRKKGADIQTVPQAYGYSNYYEGTVNKVGGKEITVISLSGEERSFVWGRKTQFFPTGYKPAIGDKIKIRTGGQKGKLFIAFEIMKFEQPVQVVVLSNKGPKGRKIEGKKRKVAILEFQSLNDEARSDNFGKMVSEIMTTTMVKSESFNVIEREQLNKVLSELKFGESGLVDSNSAQKIGKFLGADAIITGSIIKIGNTVRLDSRIIAVSTGIIEAAESGTCGVDVRGISTMCEGIVDAMIDRYYGTK